MVLVGAETVLVPVLVEVLKVPVVVSLLVAKVLELTVVVVGPLDAPDTTGTGAADDAGAGSAEPGLPAFAKNASIISLV